jgi:CheY-like chemotaxis protein
MVGNPLVQDKKCSCLDILVVDDNEFNIQTLQGMLGEYFKLHSDVAVNGVDAVAKFQQSM